ncbi:SRPBCC domain-containing protein [Bdellovibrio bacteriovorus]|uniref:Activator of Hsp90 ATPase homologue 1/2-like C-terminal domain-containing protein n=1 Tax=Bdellovibrio bacteriovorus TaxID=959 RepID=A0A162H1T0_BDEBC|nr:SRPBCC domain-containing protein [Bdellovibrio bacteriovorus]KYG69455.1 hypothetical protein AZI87_09755 [Bdellovibrio bacteriovorus]
MVTKIEKTISLKAPREDIWRALTKKNELSQWWNEGVILQPDIGGIFQEPWIDSEGQKHLASGRVVYSRENHDIVFTWHEHEWRPEWETECMLKIEDKGEERTVTLQHYGWEHFPDAQRESLQKEFDVVWDIHLKDLKKYIESGPH